MCKLAILFFMIVGYVTTANGQFNAVLYYLCEPPLSDQCVGGNTLPEGSTVEVFWDRNSNGPDQADQLVPVGIGPDSANFNSFGMNGGEYLGCSGGFYTDPAFTIFSNLPSPPRYWLRVCVPEESRQWQSNVIVIQAGYGEYEVVMNCTETACAGCQTPPPVSGVAATDYLCSDVVVTWDPYAAVPNVNSLSVRRNGVQIARVPRTQSSFIDSNAPVGTSMYGLVAVRDCGPGDSAYSAAGEDPGTRIQMPLAPADTSLHATAHPTECGKIIVRWRVPNSISSIDSFVVFQNGLEVGRTGPGTLAQIQRDTIVTSLAGPQSYSVAGWSIECGFGVPTSAVSATALVPPSQVTGLSATTGLCSVNLTWTAVAGATSYIVRRNGIQIGTPAANNFSDVTITPYTTLPFTVSAIISTNLAACQEGPQSVAVNGSRIAVPTAPSNIVASDSIYCTHVTISWTDNSFDEDSFIVRRNGVNIRTIASQATSFDDSTVVPGSVNVYTVAARNTCGVSAFPTTNNGSRKQTPPQVTGVVASEGNCNILVSWNNTIRESSFFLYRDGIHLATLPADVTSFVDEYAVANTNYSYTVRAINECGDGTLSSSSLGSRIAPPSGPTSLTAIRENCTTIALDWSPAAGSFGYYRVLRNGVQLTTVSNSSLAFEDTTVNAAMNYRYSVIAVNDSCGESTDYDTASVAGQQPAAPQVVIATQGLDATLHWNPVDTTVTGCPIAGLEYVVYFSDSVDGEPNYLGWTSDTMFTDSGAIGQADRRHYTVTADWGVQFADPNLELAVREEIGILEGPLLRQALHTVTVLDAHGRQIVCLEGIEWLSGLYYLYLYNNRITDIRPLEALPHLVGLYASSNGISDLYPLSTMSQMNALYLGSNHISDISPLSGMLLLSGLSLENNDVSDISPLTGSVQLGGLSLSGNEIVDLSPLSGMSQLSLLFLHSNQITDLTPLSGNSQIGVLDIRGNHISTLQSLVDNPGVNSGDDVYVAGNPLTPDALSVQIPMLIARGVNVYYDAAAMRSTLPDMPTIDPIFDEHFMDSFLNSLPDGIDRDRMVKEYRDRMMEMHKRAMQEQMQQLQTR